jgi:hypothetical protein
MSKSKTQKSIEPNIADLVNSWLKTCKLDYKLEQESLNTEIDKALNTYFMTFKEFYSTLSNNLTLKEAIELHYQVNPQFTRYNLFATQEGRDNVKYHDISHIIYGCDTSIDGESKVQIWNNNGSKNTTPKLSLRLIFSSDIKVLMAIAFSPDLIKHILKNLDKINALKKDIKSQASKMHKKWVYGKEDQYMDKTLGEIRAEYGIQILEK